MVAGICRGEMAAARARKKGFCKQRLAPVSYEPRPKAAFGTSFWLNRGL